MESYTNILLIFFAGTLVYTALASRLISLQRILIVQGLALFGIAVLELHHINWWLLLFILIETLVAKAILVPWGMMRLVGPARARLAINPRLKGNGTLLLVTAIITASFVLSNHLHNEHLRIAYFTVSLSAILCGLLIILNLRKAISHVIGYMILENGLFLLSLAVGAEMPMAVNAAILLDLVTSVLVLGVLVSRITSVSHTTEVQTLANLKD